MAQNYIKNLGTSIFLTAILAYTLILNYSLLSLAFTAVTVGAILLAALAYKKEQRIVEKIDIYILITFIGILAIHFEALRDNFTAEILMYNIDRLNARTIIALGLGVILGLIFNSISKSRKTLSAKAINKFIGLFFAMLGISVFCWGNFYISSLPKFLLIFTVFGLIAFCRANRSSGSNAMSRPSRISMLIAFLVIILTVMFPNFRLTQYNFNAFLSITVFPWYSVLILTLVLSSIVGMGLYFGKELIDEDTIFLTGLVGLIWVVKATVYFYFDFSWIAICVYALLFLGFTNRFVKRNGSNQQNYVHFKLINNEFYWLLIAAVSVVISVYLIHIGYIYFWLSITIGIAVVLFLHKGAPGWIRDAIFWNSLLFYIAFAACMLTIQAGFSEKKIIMIAGMFIFSSVVMWMLNYKNSIGRNKFTTGKVAMVIIFALLVAIPAYKAGSHVKIVLEDQSVNVGSLLKEETKLLITTTADGKENTIKSLQYVWSDSFLYDENDVVNASETSPKLDIMNNHLILWTQDEFGVVSRKDCWFYDTTRENTITTEVYKIVAK